MEYRIEQLARAGGVAVDTIRFYQGKGLLSAPRRQGRYTLYDHDHLIRLTRIRELQQRGFTLTVIRRFLNGELEPSDESLVAAVTRPQSNDTLTLEDLSRSSGVAAPILRELQRGGLLVPIDPSAKHPRFPAGDLTALSAGLKLVEAGIPLGELLELARSHALSAETTARQAVELFDRHVRERMQAAGGPASGVEPELLELFTGLLDAAGVLVRHHFERTLVRAAREHIERSEA
ncbi:MAG TPA: MerR family transcriptional regulator [Candidatus Dormibacteraeota bacterium]|jgi:DNA-binding transcriptional MerR regulator|nr:MerR family transcriptional regulator [Candidatus Dormibacteraeota bacterium]